MKGWMPIVAIAILAVIGFGLLSVALANFIGSIPIAWAIGFMTAMLFRLIDRAALKRLPDPPSE